MKVSLLLSIQAIALAAQGHPAAHPRDNVPIPPSEDPFYTPPEGFETTAPGSILTHREIPYPFVSLGPESKLASAHHILYRTNDNFGHATATVTTVLIPENADPTKLLSFQLAEDAAYINCAPSYTMQQDVDEGLGGLLSKGHLLLVSDALQRGWVVAIPDFEGSNGAFLANFKAGYATLDGIRAVLSSGDFTGIAPAAAVAMWGYSGGSLASGFAAELQPLYAPELHIVGAALGGVIGDIAKTVPLMNKSPSAGIIVMGLHGLSNEYPEIAALVTDNLVDDPAKREKFLKARQQCSLDASLSFAFDDVTSYFNNPDFINDPLLLQVQHENDMGQRTPRIPLLVYKGLFDETSPVNDTEKIVSRYCADGVAVDYREVVTHEHQLLSIDGFLDAIPWLSDRLDGTPVEQTCTKRSQLLPISNIDSVDVLVGTVGEDADYILGSVVDSIL